MNDYVFNQNSPHVIVVDNFYKDPDAIVKLAYEQEFKENAIAKFVALGFTEAELRALGITSDGNN